MKKHDIKENPFILFSPFLIILIAIVLIFPTNGISGDQNRYLLFARNLMQGFYSPPEPATDLGKTPGYPLIILPFLAFKLPLISITILNAFLYYFSIVILYKILFKFVSVRLALIVTLFWACYINAYRSVPLIEVDTITEFLVTLIALSLVRVFSSGPQTRGNKWLLLSGFLIGCLALIKPIFGYVILFMMVGSVMLLAINKKVINYKRGLVVLLIAFSTNIPYLIYTYNLTGQVLYWADNGGVYLYWLSTPNKKEYGSYYGFMKFRIDSVMTQYLIPGGEESIKANHSNNMEKILKYQGFKRDDAFKKIAIENIKLHPLKYLQNCISNLGRILFDIPYSYKAQKPIHLANLPLNGIISVFTLLCIIPTFINWKKVLFPIKFLLFFAFLYLAGSIFGGSAEMIKFSLIVPIVLFWIAYIIDKSVFLKLRFE